MTDEEKAESYIRENVCNKERVFGSQSVCSDKAIRECNECGNFCYFAKINRKSFIDGLKASRKENEQLKAQIEKLKSDLEQLLDEKIEVEDKLAESRECY